MDIPIPATDVLFSGYRFRFVAGGPNPDFVGVQAVSEDGSETLGTAVRLMVLDNRIKAETPGVDGTYFHQNGAGQIEIVGRS